MAAWTGTLEAAGSTSRGTVVACGHDGVVWPHEDGPHLAA